MTTEGKPRPDAQPPQDGATPALSPATLAVHAGEANLSPRARRRCQSSTASPTATTTSTPGWRWRSAGSRTHLQPQHQSRRCRRSRKRCACSKTLKPPPASRPAWRRSATRCLRFWRPADRVVSVKDTYGGTNKFFTEFLPRHEVECRCCDTV